MGHKELIICGAGYMSLPAITDEITEAAADRGDTPANRGMTGSRGLAILTTPARGWDPS